MRISTAVKVAAVLAFLLSSCGGVTDVASGVGSNTNWLSPCSDGASCGGGLSCLCGVCTVSCADARCSGNTECVVPSHDTCQSTLEPVCLALCSSDASCVAALGEGFACVAGRCEAQPAGGRVDEAPSMPGPAGFVDTPDDSGGASSMPTSSVDPAQVRIEVRRIPDFLPPQECVKDLPLLLPGCDPSVPAYSGIDCDDDGVPDYQLWRCEVAAAQAPQEFSAGYDCDPTDPGLRHWVYSDADGDGFGFGEALCAGPTIPQGYILADGGSPTDCDDLNASTHPGAPDVWGDLVDSDCSEGDSPSCAVLTSGADFVRSSLRPSSCPGGGPDLVLSTLAHCGSRCPSDGAFYLFVGNAGTTAAAGPIRVAWSDDTGAGGIIEVSPGSLAPGDMTTMFTVPTNRSKHTEVAIDFEDCSPENGKFVDDDIYGDLVCL